MHNKKIRLLSTGTISPDIIEKMNAPLISVDIIPFTSIQAITDPAVDRFIADVARRKATVVFTSINAVRAVVNKLPAVPDWTIYCTSGPTLREANSFFGKKSVKAAAENAALLAGRIIEEKTTEVVFFCGNQRLDVMPNALANAAIPVTECIVYESSAVRHALHSVYDGLLFYSPLAVKTFFLDNALSAETVVFALGSTTSEAIRNYISNDIRMAPAPEKSELLKFAIDYFTFQTIQGS